MLGGRLFWFLVGIGVGLWLNFWIKRRLKKMSIQRQISNRIRAISSEVRSAISEGREAIRQNGR